mmetsp:Transcript_2044/g.3620  ORF Transcript_2044/g.3620 Transcript_2044/m.3620 type:complete len:218 (+) Transcript_2044:149-802(+)
MLVYWNHIRCCAHLGCCLLQHHQSGCREGTVVHVSNQPLASINCQVDQNAMVRPCSLDPSIAWYDIVSLLQRCIRHSRKNGEWGHHLAPVEIVHFEQDTPPPALFALAAVSVRSPAVHIPCPLAPHTMPNNPNSLQISWALDSHCYNLYPPLLPLRRLLPLPRANNPNYAKSTWHRSLCVDFEEEMEFEMCRMDGGHWLLRVDVVLSNERVVCAVTS